MNISPIEYFLTTSINSLFYKRRNIRDNIHNIVKGMLYVYCITEYIDYLEKHLYNYIIREIILTNNIIIRRLTYELYMFNVIVNYN